MNKRTIGGEQVHSMGYGCMGLSHGYGPAVSSDQAQAVLLQAIHLGATLFDTAALYANGVNETVVGRVLAPHRQNIMLASKCGLNHPDAGADRRNDGRPESIRASCEASLRRLQTDVIDLFYLHRMDPAVPIEDSVGAMADLQRQGKVRMLGLSEVSATTLRKAHAVAPIAALQSEYSLCTRNPEIAVLQACKELGVALVAFSPLGRAYLSTKLTDPSKLHASDMRRKMPRFDVLNYAANLRVLDRFTPLVAEANCTPSQLALAWVLHQGEHIIPIPGTCNLMHLQENMQAVDVKLGPDLLRRLNDVFQPHEICGPRYPQQAMLDVDTEQFDDS